MAPTCSSICIISVIVSMKFLLFRLWNFCYSILFFLLFHLWNFAPGLNLYINIWSINKDDIQSGADINRVMWGLRWVCIEIKRKNSNGNSWQHKITKYSSFISSRWSVSNHTSIVEGNRYSRGHQQFCLQCQIFRWTSMGIFNLGW